jgi:nickel-dependent lactate racemase
MGSNLVLADSMEACKLAGPTFNISFVPDGWGGVDSAFAGELEATFKEAAARYLKTHTARIDRKADIVIASAGALLGMDLYHGVRVLPNVWDIVRKDGTIILVAECSQGIGDSAFLNYTRRFEERRALLTELRHNFRLGGHVSLLLREALERNRVQLVSVLPDHYERDSFKLKPSKTGSSAVQQAVRVEGKDAKILIVTRGDLTLPTVVDNPRPSPARQSGVEGQH